MTAYTTTLQLTQQVDGTNTGTWGDVVNLVFAQVDQAANGVLSLSVAGSSNVTLAWPQGTASSNQANNIVAKFTGALTGNITVFYPATSRRMIVQNATTGAYTLTVNLTGTPGTGMAVPQGSQMILWTDGTNVYNSLNNYGPASFIDAVGIAGGLTVDTILASSNATIGGTLSVTGTSTLTGNATLTGTVSIGGAATVTGTLNASVGTAAGQVVNYSQFPYTSGSPGTETMPSGRIMKWGTGSTTSGTGSVTFGTAFPNACDNVVITINGGSGTISVNALVVGTISASTFAVWGAATQSLGFYWTAIGH